MKLILMCQYVLMCIYQFGLLQSVGKESLEVDVLASVFSENKIYIRTSSTNEIRKISELQRTHIVAC